MEDVEGGEVKWNISRLQQFQTCEQKYKWKYVEDLEPKWDGLPKPLGKAFHEGIAAIYKGMGKAKALDVAELAFHAELPLGWTELDGKEVQKITKGEMQLRDMIERYPWKPEDDVVAIEKDMEWEVVSGKVLVFRADRLIRVNGALWLHDTKTTGLDVAQMVRVQRLRTQYVGYAAGVEAIMGERLVGVMLDVVHKPEVYFKKTGEFSSMKESGYLREPINKTEAQLHEFKTWFVDMVQGVEDSKVTGRWHKNTDSCLMFNSVCPYIDLCLRPDWAEGMKGLFNTREKDYADEGGREDE